jgi:hypothetical protein
MLLERAGQRANLESIGHVIDFMIGRSDNVSIVALRDALEKAGIRRPEDLAEAQALGRLDRALDAVGARGQQIRGQVVSSDPGSAKPTDLPLAFQLFGQRFVIDSFALSRVVYDGIVYRGEKQRRSMPKGLDAMAALGSDEATRLLEPEIRKWSYASNLLAARRVVERMTPEEWGETGYNGWLAALRTLDDLPSSSFVPAVMRREPWRRKQLQTALASWAELRHDTILYAKQSYTSGALCEYPAGFVEPYPEFFARVGELTSTLSTRLSAVNPPEGLPEAARLGLFRDRLIAFFRSFSKTMSRLGDLAARELAGVPFSKADTEFLKRTIDIRGGGSGGPHYSGWYPRLVYGGKPDAYMPTIADVHSDPITGTVLEEAVGDVGFMVVAVDNGPDRMAYVGPVYSYYELTAAAHHRMTDEEWAALIAAGKTPARPEFTRVFQAPGEQRVLERRKRVAPRKRSHRRR